MTYSPFKSRAHVAFDVDGYDSDVGKDDENHERRLHAEGGRRQLEDVLKIVEIRGGYRSSARGEYRILTIHFIQNSGPDN